LSEQHILMLSENGVRRRIFDLLGNGKLEKLHDVELHKLYHSPNILKVPKPTNQEGMGRIHVAHDRGQWWTVVNTVMNLRDLYKVRGLE
jgi:hypothetical protein